tara:strand:- start:5524 stop:5784 length:261 start_codon:yes stop_codon:yes gene_type:complete
MADQDKFEKTTEEEADMETTVNGELIKSLFIEIDKTIDNANAAKKGILTLADGKTISFSATIGKSSSLTISVASGLTVKKLVFPLK